MKREGREMGYYDEYFDHVECMNCSFHGLIPLGEVVCPDCGGEEFLAWADEEEPERNKTCADYRCHFREAV
jgi:hypothetical protein